MYEAHVMEHFGEPYHEGPLPYGSSDTIYEGASASEPCGDEVTIQARIEDDVITEIWWRGEGCCFSQAAASMLVKYTDGRTVDDMRAFSEDEMFELFKAECPSIRRGCVLVTLNALQNLLETYS